MAVKQGVGGVPPLEATAEPFRGYDAAIRLAFVPLEGTVALKDTASHKGGGFPHEQLHQEECLCISRTSDVV
ncbi:hypothetical protein [Pleurocapsa sp. PCC 7319]|uniref:hypothetical protein n=1 Tax=Pleurocapsa sp. PCC 7319 TaxID=118161 RepID=UPI00034A7977